ncbi:pilus assembly protein [Mesorhizobium abyssinicae]|uniref:pilus assembly protein n=1 Tax=Mesorhizobium abyssinicae TaxID=1209958 RepID=UPI002A2422D6|nr:pilus assembly protein [Mesorhizobium abyssinicae]MDX8433847.1 pilus assembly protein [Mesorhizobium abyssinicae]
MLLKNFWRSKRGNFALVLALGVPAILTAVAFATDVSTLMKARSNLQNALDAANLASSHLGDIDISRSDAFNRYFQANVATHRELSNAQATLSVDKGVTYIKTKAVASADVNLNFAFLFGDDRHITVDASAMESNNQLEVVLVLDNTGSMAGARISALRQATKSLIDYLEAAKSPTRQVRASLVPFVTAVNVNGPDFDPSWIDLNGKSSTNGINFPAVKGKRPDHMSLFKQLQQDVPALKHTGWKGTGWKGCVEARPGAYNISDTPPDPSNPDTLFVPYLAPDDPDVARKPSASYGNSSTGYNNSYLDDTIDKIKLALPGANVLGIDLSGVLDANVSKVARYVASTNKIVTETGNTITVGPNRACPTPIVPLTNDFDSLRAAAAQMSEWNGSGTNVSEGLAWGMRVLSPQPPYTDATPWKTSGVGKVVMLLTDGENVVYGASGQPTKSDYTSYGYLGGGRFGSDNQTAAARNVDGWTKDVCTQLKSQGVQVYTMVLQADTAANRALYSACASDPSDYYAVNDPSKLPNVFQTIASKFSKLQLTN